MELELVCLGVSVEPRRRLARCPPHFFGLDGLRGVEGEATADVAGVGVRVADDDVSRWVQRVLAVAKKPLANAATLHARPLAAAEGEVVVLLEERPVGKERRAERRPLVLLSAFAVVRLGPTAALQANIVFPEVLDVVALRSPDLV